MKQVEASGRTVEEAVDRALTELGAAQEDAEIEVLDPGTRGMLGLGARDVRVRVTLKAAPAAEAHQLAVRLLGAMGFAVTVRVHERDEVIAVEVHGQDLGALIGRRGSTLEALELLLGLMVSRSSGVRRKVVVDVEGYWERRQQSLENLARKIAERVHRQGREVMLQPMAARERRIVHTTLAGHPDVLTYSSGEGAARRVVIAPRRNAGAGAQHDGEPIGA